MTRSARRSNKANAMPHQVSTSDMRCEECHGPLLHRHGISYTCSVCGLEQEIEKEASFFDDDSEKNKNEARI